MPLDLSQAGGAWSVRNGVLSVDGGVQNGEQALKLFLLGTGMDVRPHPHIGLATVTFLFDGEIVHRDSLGTDIPIRPGALEFAVDRRAPEADLPGCRGG